MIRRYRHALACWLSIFLTFSGRASCGAGRTFNLMSVGDELSFGGTYPWPGSKTTPVSTEGYQPARYLDPLRTMIADNGRAVNWVGSCCRTCRGMGFMKQYPECIRGCAPKGRIHHMGFAKWSSSQMLSGNGPPEFRTTSAIAFKDWIKDTYRIPDVALFYVGTYDVAQKVRPQEYASNIVSMITEVRKINPQVVFIVATSLLPSSSDPATAAQFAALKTALEPLLGSKSLNTTLSPIYAIDVAAGTHTKYLLQAHQHAGSPDFKTPNHRGTIHIAERFASVLLPLLDRMQKEGKPPPMGPHVKKPPSAAGPKGTSASKVAGKAQPGGKGGAAKVGGAALVGGGHVRSGQKVHVNLSGDDDRNCMVLVAASAAAIAGLLCGLSFAWIRRWRSASGQRSQGRQYELVAPGK
mmetsp:Transcript_27775/g.64660  ORF Transcript_27775/g.64660 Transcript_27775/m.64660 type:complete len:410 (+) Transcript_27775:1433-2662(+)